MSVVAQRSARGGKRRRVREVLHAALHRTVAQRRAAVAQKLLVAAADGHLTAHMQEAALVAKAAEALAMFAADLRPRHVQQHTAILLVARPEEAGGANIVERNRDLLPVIYAVPAIGIAAGVSRVRLAVRQRSGGAPVVTRGVGLYHSARFFLAWWIDDDGKAQRESLHVALGAMRRAAGGRVERLLPKLLHHAGVRMHLKAAVSLAAASLHK